DEGAYQVSVDRKGVRLEASSHVGFVHASATLLQLVRPDGDRLRVPHIVIKDAPRFKYRGMMLDCARHFHPLERVKRLINQLAHYKFNTFHWHLTDDEGWRIEIKALPQLTDIGAWRGVDEVLEPQYSLLTEKHGGFYTQDDIREVIAYAAERGITVIPEIDIPGHSRAAIKALPEWLLDEDDQSQYRSIQYYNDNVLSPALSGTYRFLDLVLEEVAALFPSNFIHIGADEVPDGVWVNSPKCQALMAEQGYTDAKELQGHLLRYAEKKLKSLGKRMVGWEEAQHGDKVSKDTVIYSWLSEQAALNCARQGFDVILQPGQFTYLDSAQDYAPEEPGVDWAGVTPLERAYRYEPLAEVPEQDPLRKRILGIQCALWCELVNNQNRMDYMIYPRLTALAEAAWTQKSQRDW
ncbi:MAG: beta-N-acetylhexosaminidase, partial [Vibrio fluvialis]